jgi:hypothetical protein
VGDLGDEDQYDPMDEDEQVEFDPLAKEVELMGKMEKIQKRRGRPPKNPTEEDKPKRKYTRHTESERDNPMLPVAIATGTIPIRDAIEIAQACRALESDAEVRPFLAGVRWAYDHLKKE